MAQRNMAMLSQRQQHAPGAGADAELADKLATQRQRNGEEDSGTSAVNNAADEPAATAGASTPPEEPEDEDEDSGCEDSVEASMAPAPSTVDAGGGAAAVGSKAPAADSKVESSSSKSSAKRTEALFREAERRQVRCENHTPGFSHVQRRPYVRFRYHLRFDRQTFLFALLFVAISFHTMRGIIYNHALASCHDCRLTPSGCVCSASGTFDPPTHTHR